MEITGNGKYSTETANGLRFSSFLNSKINLLPASKIATRQSYLSIAAPVDGAVRDGPGHNSHELSFFIHYILHIVADLGHRKSNTCGTPNEIYRFTWATSHGYSLHELSVFMYYVVYSVVNLSYE